MVDGGGEVGIEAGGVDEVGGKRGMEGRVGLVFWGFRQALREREHGWVPYFLFPMLRSA